MGETAPITGNRLAQAQPAPQPDPQPGEDLPWGDAPPPPTPDAEPAPSPEPDHEAPADGESTEAAQQPWRERPEPATFVRQPWFPNLRFGFAGQFVGMQESGNITGGGRFDMYFTHPELTVVPSINEIPVPISFFPRLETTINPEFQTITGGLSVHLMPPDLISLYINIMAGMAHVSPDEEEMREESYNFALTSDVGAQVRIPIRSPLMLVFLEYNRSWISPVIANGASAGLRFEF